MSRYESEARDILLRRLSAIRRQVGHGVTADPTARWLDVDGLPEPMSESLRRELKEVEAALGRLADGKYGTCQSCGGPMGLQRIRALPEARFCVGCSGQGLAAE
jgi:RNA polymerase-binding transcription factor